MVLLAGLCDWTGLQAGLCDHSWMGGASSCALQLAVLLTGLLVQAGLCPWSEPQVVPCNLVEPQAVP